MKHAFTLWLLLAACFSMRAQTPDVSYTSPGLYTYTVPATGPFVVRMSVTGGSGGRSFVANNFGGGGARALSTFALQPGDQLTLMVGQSGDLNIRGSGGGGGSAVILTRGTQQQLLLVAGGGGGGGDGSAGQGGQGASTSANGGAGGSVNGQLSGAGGGGGYGSAGATGEGDLPGTGGGQASLTALSPGGSYRGQFSVGGSGFGGGGGGNDNYIFEVRDFRGNGGGGGGYSGGTGGSATGGGGGGGSYVDAAGQNTAISPGEDGSGGNDGLVRLSFPISNATASLTGGPALCAAGGSVTLSGTVQASGSWTLVLSDGTILSGTGSSFSTTVQPTTSTTYTIQALYDAAGEAPSTNLTGSRTVSTQNPTARISPTNPTITCSSPTVSLTASGGESYLWEDGSTEAVRSVSVAGTYSVAVTGEGCSATTSVEVAGSSQAPTVLLENNGPLSAGQPTVTLTATEIAGATYAFSSGTAPGSTPNTATVTTPGTYSVTVTTSGGCTATTQTTVEGNAGTVTGFELINTNTDQVIKTLSNNEVINLGTLPTSRLTIRANTSPSMVGSVVFSLTGSKTYSKTETSAPYSLFGDSNGNYDPWNLTVGSYTLTATPYLGPGGTGAAGTPLTLNFSIVNQPPTSGLAVISYTLINADTEQPIKTLSNNEVLNLASLPRNLNIRANTSPATVGSVVMQLSGAQSQRRTETGTPYALFGDNSGNYNAWRPVVGSYTLRSTPYSGAGGQGSAGTALTINFRVTGQAPAAKLSAEAASEPVQVYPNPFRESFTLKNAPRGPVVLYDLTGRKILEREGVADEQRLEPGSQVVPGLYLLQVGQGKDKRHFKLIKTQ